MRNVKRHLCYIYSISLKFKQNSPLYFWLGEGGGGRDGERMSPSAACERGWVDLRYLLLVPWRRTENDFTCVLINEANQSGNVMLLVLLKKRTVMSGQVQSWRNKAKQNCCPAHSPVIHRPRRAYRLLQLALSPGGWKQTLAPSEQSKRSGFWARFSSLDPLSQAADIPIQPLVWDRFAWGSTPSDPMNILAHSDHKALSVPIVSLRHTCVEMPC